MILSLPLWLQLRLAALFERSAPTDVGGYDCSDAWNRPGTQSGISRSAPSQKGKAAAERTRGRSKPPGSALVDPGRVITTCLQDDSIPQEIRLQTRQRAPWQTGPTADNYVRRARGVQTRSIRPLFRAQTGLGRVRTTRQRTLVENLEGGIACRAAPEATLRLPAGHLVASR